VRHEISPGARTVAGRLAAILLTLRAGGSHSLTEMARLTGLPISTVHRLVGELASHQLLRRAVDGRYEIGPNMLRLIGGGCVPDLDERGLLLLADLAEATGRRVRMGVLRGDQVLYIEKRPGPEPATPWSAWATLPAHATALGKVLLAFAPRQSVVAVQEALAVYTPRTISTPDGLHRELQLVRLTRCANSRGELIPDDCAVACPVFGPGGTVVAALELRVHDLGRDVALCRTAIDVAARGLSRELSFASTEDASTDDGDGRRHLRLLPGSPDSDGMASSLSVPRLL